MFERFMPKSIDFVDYFERHSEIIIAACREMDGLAAGTIDLEAGTSRIMKLEHEADIVAHDCMQTLQRTFITPFDRLHIHELIKGLDDVLDAVEDAASRYALYELKEPRPEMKQLTELVVKSAIAIKEAVGCLRNLKYEDKIAQTVISVHRLENDGDHVLRLALKRLFAEEKNPLLVIQWKEIFEQLEFATDRCEDVADIIEGVILEAS